MSLNHDRDWQKRWEKKEEHIVGAAFAKNNDVIK